jgi:hypothetical protein
MGEAEENAFRRDPRNAKRLIVCAKYGQQVISYPSSRCWNFQVPLGASKTA